MREVCQRPASQNSMWPRTSRTVGRGPGSRPARLCSRVPSGYRYAFAESTPIVTVDDGKPNLPRFACQAARPSPLLVLLVLLVLLPLLSSPSSNTPQVRRGGVLYPGSEGRLPPRTCRCYNPADQLWPPRPTGYLGIRRRLLSVNQCALLDRDAAVRWFTADTGSQACTDRYGQRPGGSWREGRRRGRPGRSLDVSVTDDYLLHLPTNPHTRSRSLARWWHVACLFRALSAHRHRVQTSALDSAQHCPFR
ncbi:hypothetical protein F4780DRAFT_27064 [Xylariomycetidae sp. FL0641]|nr:hypothetical protein F4780DRAFT_27064 [Xylariomycetidae sp. FL0641]